MRFLTFPKFFGIRGPKFRKGRLNFGKVKSVARAYMHARHPAYMYARARAVGGRGVEKDLRWKR